MKKCAFYFIGKTRWTFWPTDYVLPRLTLPFSDESYRFQEAHVTTVCFQGQALMGFLSPPWGGNIMSIQTFYIYY